MSRAPESENYNWEEWNVKIKGVTMKAFFDKVIDTILQLLEKEVSRAARADGQRLIHLVARRSVDWIIRDRSKTEQTELWVGSRRLFREDIDPKESAGFCAWTKEKISCKMTWFIAKGEIIDERTRIILSVYGILVEDGSFIQSENLLTCSLDIPPIYAFQDGIERVAKLKHILTQADVDNFENRILEGKRCWKIKYLREIHPGIRQGTLFFKVKSNVDGREFGHGEIQYDNTVVADKAHVGQGTDV
ncbi:hypothetical protein EK21DRAFT_117508 [Setomelanomma holmii]|uniref:Uncharacterized protein n=1 Tax=Setomelanomma holmii TaxID=210430 RepID=A0A9P4LHN9_9PLEO|nr:hypothetical protein EK21DRAFT_117508 [Setomelanomma holmii]